MHKDNSLESRNHFFGIFTIALAVLAYQVLLTRLFSVTLYYHFAFAGITLAMLGLTVGAERVYLHAQRFTRERLEREWAKAAIGFSISSVALVIWFLYASLIVPPEHVFFTLAASIIVFVVPFIYSGICVTLILTKSGAASVGKLYAADLIGAAAGCIGVVLALFVLDPVSIVFVLAALTSYAAWRMARKEGARLARFAALLACFWLAAGLVQGGLYLSGNDHLRVIWAKAKPQEKPLFERWNTFSCVRVIPYWSTVPFGWGYGHPRTENIEQYYLDIDIDAATILTHFTGDLKPLAYLGNDIVNMGYHIRKPREVAVIGVGGGRDIMSALLFGVAKVTGIEMNPAILEALEKKFADFTGHFTGRPDVRIVNAEARSWLNQSRQKFDLIQISLIDTWAATAAGGLTLTENKLYTREAWKEFLDHQTPGGMLVVSRWFDEKRHRGEFYRLLSLAADSLRDEGVPPDEIRRHILAFRSARIITVAVSRSPYSEAEIARAEAAAREQGFTVMLTPARAWDDISATIASGKADKAFYEAQPLDFSSSTDDRPFFFYMLRLKDALHFQKGTEGLMSLYNNAAVAVVVSLFFCTFVCVFAFILQPLITYGRRAPLKGMVPHLAYFGGIGLGFMLIEISQMQRLMVFLGHPVYGLSVVLFTLLFFGGLGSATVVSDKSPWLRLRPLMLMLALIVTGLATPALTDMLKVYETPARILISVALLAPAGFCMGMMFPLGMLQSARHQALQPWFWGINGATSVFASVLGMIISMEWGIASAYWCGVACYAACLLLALCNTKAAAS